MLKLIWCDLEDKVMKKVLSLMAVICCISLIFCLPVGADATNEVLFEVDVYGDTVTVDITTEFNCGAIQGILSYEGSEIAYQNSSFAEGLTSINSAANRFSDSSGSTKIALVCAANGGVNGNLATLTYTANAGVPAIFDFGAMKVFGTTGNKLSNVKSVMVMYGDTDNNGLVNILDLICLKKTLAGRTSVIAGKERNFDLDKNGSTNANDLSGLILKLLR